MVRLGLLLLLFSVYLLRTEGRIAGSRTGNLAGSHNQPASCTRTLTYSRYYDLNRVCNDCFKLYDDPHIYGLCRYKIALFMQVKNSFFYAGIKYC